MFKCLMGILTEIEFTHDAMSQWESAYQELSQGHPGTLGDATSRAVAHVRRLALIYALFDEAETVDTQHLKAAHALWSYCHASAEPIFGGLGVKAHEIYERLRLAFPREMDRTSLHNATGCNLATSRKEPTGGAPRELWRAVMNLTN